MNDVGGVIGIEDEDDLKWPVSPPPAPHEELTVTPEERPGRRRILNDAFGLLRIDAVFGDVLNVPVIPAELHRSTEGSLPQAVYYFNKKLTRRTGFCLDRHPAPEPPATFGREKTLPQRKSRLSCAMNSWRISFGQAREHSPWFVHVPKPSSSICATIESTRS